MTMDSSSFSTLGTAVRNQVYPSTEPSGQQIKSVKPQARNTTIPLYSLSELVDFVEILKLPLINTVRSSLLEPENVLLGKGGFGQVMFEETGPQTETTVRDISPGTMMAVKSLATVANDQDHGQEAHAKGSLTISQAFVELAVMTHPKLANHMNVLNCFGLRLSDFISPYNTSVQLSLVTEYADMGSLHAYIHQNSQNMEWSLKRQILSDIVEGLSALHKCDIVHNDMKGENVLLFAMMSPKRNIVAKVADFGCSMLSASRQKCKQRGGTWLFASPEADDADFVTPSRDVYSFGLVILHVAQEERPFLEFPTMAEKVSTLKKDVDALQQYVSKRLSDSNAPEDLTEITLACLKTQNERPPNCIGLLENGPNVAPQMDNATTTLVHAWQQAVSKSPLTLDSTFQKVISLRFRLTK